MSAARHWSQAVTQPSADCEVAQSGTPGPLAWRQLPPPDLPIFILEACELFLGFFSPFFQCRDSNPGLSS